MNLVYAYTAIAALIFILIYITDYDWKEIFSNPYVIIGILGFLIRFAIAKLIPGYPTDISCFKSWGQMLFDNGLSNFYTSNNFTDYPPGYMYVLFITGMLRHIMNLPYDSSAYTLLVKMPSIIADILTAMLICRIASKKFNKNTSLAFGLFYVLNPLVIFISSGWGQVDSVHTLFILLSVYYLHEQKLLQSMLIFTAAVLIKPQSLMFSPIFLYAFYERIKHDKNGLKQVAKYIGICAAALIFLAMPFTKNLNYAPIIKQYYSTVMDSYQYASVNAYNLYTAAGLNWRELTPAVSMSGAIAIVGIVIFSFYVLNKTKNKPNYFFVAALINLLTFMFSIKMHERYSFPMLALLLTSIVYRMDKKLIFMYAAFTVTNFINCADILYMIQNGNNLSLIATSSKLISIANLALTAYAVYAALYLCTNPKEDTGKLFMKTHPLVPFAIEKSQPALKLSKNDFIFMALVTVIYAFIAFYQLGDKFSPQTMFSANTSDEVIVDYGDSYSVSRVQYMFGHKNDKRFSVSFSEDGYGWSEPVNINPSGVFSWNETSLGVRGRYVRVVSDSDELYLLELAFRDNAQNLIPVSVISDRGRELFDEQSMVPMSRNYMNGTYFDEIYHARTAYEFIHRLQVYEWTHPPLGKSLISVGIMIFGMNPFGWRFMGALFGVLMVPVIYIFGKRLFNNTFFALFATVVFTFDFMHFAQTRIATIDAYVTFFIICMFYFMYEYYSLSFYDTDFKKTLKPLCLSGVCFGLAAASKWQGIYAATGLAVIFFMAMFRRWREYNYAKQQKMNKITSVFPKYFSNTIKWCLLFFIVIPVVIYFLSYFQYSRCEGVRDLQAIIKEQSGMLNYHAGTKSEHPYQSAWWSWPFLLRPILYSLETVSQGVKSTITSFNNPAISWVGIGAFFYVIASYSRKRDKTAIFILVAFLAQYLTWIPIGRTTYMYHFFPSMPFIVFMITYMFKDKFSDKRLAIGYMCLVVILFIAFYNVISGVPVDVAYVQKYLKWLPGWQFV